MFWLSEDGRQDTGDCGGLESVEAAVVRNYEVTGGPSFNNRENPFYMILWFLRALISCFFFLKLYCVDSTLWKK